MHFKTFFYKLWHWESWHYLAKYIPIMPVWAYYCFKAKSVWFFTPSNPTISFGGFEGETKSEMYAQLPPNSYPTSIYIQPSLSINQIIEMVEEANLHFPIAAKPDAGMMGFMFRRINNQSELGNYHKKMPVNYILQALIDFPLEVSVFYYRFPNQHKGTISGFVKKEFLQVIGNGTSTLLALILNDELVRFRVEEMKSKHASNLNKVIPNGETYFLSYALNLSRGSKLISLKNEIDQQLLNIFDGLSNYTKHFYYGRYDIKCASIEELKLGKNFYILEYNGCGAEPHHAYGNKYTLWQAYKIFTHHWKVLYQISQYNHLNGFKRWNFKKGWQYLKNGKANYRLIKKLDAETPV